MAKNPLKTAILGVLYSYEPGQTVTEEHEQLLRDVLAMHPEAAAKVGCGIISFHVEQNRGSRGFWLTRLDGTRTDWSYLACLRAPTHRTRVLAALREAVSDQVAEFKNRVFSAGPVRCAVTGDVLSKTNCHIDHEIGFLHLAEAWNRGKDFRAIQIKPTEDKATAAMLADDDLRESWCVYHARHAKLRALLAAANLGRRRKDLTLIPS